MNSPNMVNRLIKSLAVLLAFGPLAQLFWDFQHDGLSANPVADITNATGIWTLRFVLITLAVTPVSRLTGWGSLSRFRRMAGLIAFMYGCLHLTTYIWLDQFFAWGDMVKDIGKRPFITVGVLSFTLMIPLAVTSFNRAIRWMGGKRWKKLHRLVYLTAVGGVIHYLWLVKADRQRPLIYGALLLVLLGFRVWEPACRFLLPWIRAFRDTLRKRLPA